MLEQLLADAADDIANAGLDACTLNNVMNAVQIAILVSLLRWVRGDSASGDRR